MTDWKKVQSSQAEKPTGFDISTSAVVVYQRKNIECVTVENIDGTTAELWAYDEREMSREEYNMIRCDLMQAEISANSAVIDEFIITELEG